MSLLDHCNRKIDSPSVLDLIAETQNRVFTNFSSSIITKIVMFTGIKNQHIKSISLDDLDLELNTIRLSKFWIHLPDDLGRQLKKYIKVRSEIVKGNEGNRNLFILRNGNSVGNNNSFMFSVLEDVFGDKVAGGVAKYAIMEMIRKGVCYRLIMDFTGFSFQAVQHCQELVDDRCGVSQADQNRQLDSSLRGLPTYDIL